MSLSFSLCVYYGGTFTLWELENASNIPVKQHALRTQKLQSRNLDLTLEGYADKPSGDL